jgi:hypothetical protein
MTKSRRGAAGQAPSAGAAAHPGRAGREPSLGNLHPRAAASAPESLLAKGPLANPKIQAPIFPGAGLGASSAARISVAEAHEAHRCAMEGVRLVTLGRAAQGVDLLKRSVKLNPAVASSHHDLGVALLAAGRPEQAADALSAALRLDSRLATRS